MKLCPTCKRTYDDTLRFCLEDGVRLNRLDPSSAATLTMPAGQSPGDLLSTVVYQAGMSSGSTAKPERHSRNRWAIIGVVLLAVIIGLVSAVSWYTWSTIKSEPRQIQTAYGARLPTEFRLGESVPSDGLTAMTVRGSNEKVYLHSQAILTNYHVASASAVNSPYGAQIKLQLTDAGREILAQVTGKNINKQLGIVVGREVLCAPTIMTPIPDGEVLISGNFTEEEAMRLAQDIMGR